VRSVAPDSERKAAARNDGHWCGATRVVNHRIFVPLGSHVFSLRRPAWIVPVGLVVAGKTRSATQGSEVDLLTPTRGVGGG